MPRTDTSLTWQDIMRTIDAVFPYPYRGLLAALSKRYRQHVTGLYANSSLRFKLLDGGLSAAFALAEIVLIIGVPLLLVAG